jgi:hypothetical protein
VSLELRYPDLWPPRRYLTYRGPSGRRCSGCHGRMTTRPSRPSIFFATRLCGTRLMNPQSAAQRRTARRRPRREGFRLFRPRAARQESRGLRAPRPPPASHLSQLRHTSNIARGKPSPLATVRTATEVPEASRSTKRRAPSQFRSVTDAAGVESPDIGTGMVLLVPFIGLLAPSLRESSRDLPPEASIRNSYFGFVHGLLNASDAPKRGPRRPS